MTTTPVSAGGATTDTTTTQSTATETGTNDILPIAGAAAAGLLLLGGGAALLNRRRRDAVDEAEVYEAERKALPPEPLVEPEPVMAAPVIAAPALAHEPITQRSGTAMPEGFDVSRFGRHTQAAYAGPSADNPSLSLKKRLHRAAFFDLRERQALEAQRDDAAGFEEAMPDHEPAQATRTDTVRTAPPVAPARRPSVNRPGPAPMFGYRPAFQN